MKFAVLTLLIASLPSVVLGAGAVVLALNGIGIWGWFLGISVLTNPAFMGLNITMHD
jgi:hypothetical protein